MENQILDEAPFVNPNLRRRDLLPIWVKVFVWIFLLFGAVIPVALFFGITGGYFELSLYGLETGKPLSLIGMTITLLFVFKAVVAFGLWTEKKWAVKMAIVDAIIGIITCLVAMPIFSFFGADRDVNFSVTFRFELIILICYLLKMWKIRGEWRVRN